MGRAPCCEKMGLKKGPWTPQEDKILISHIQKHGHSNWRALPKQAGLLRCGKSCRLRWINYLRPDIKRGNFSEEEEDTIIKLHEMLGNKWSAIAAKLPGRTDNEIKNVWHTHLKKKLKQKQESNDLQHVTAQKCEPTITGQSAESQNSELSTPESQRCETMSPHPCLSELSTTTENSFATAETDSFDLIKQENMDLSETFLFIDEIFWSQPEMGENCSMFSDVFDLVQFELPTDIRESRNFDTGPEIDDGMDFWYNVFVKSGGIEELL